MTRYGAQSVKAPLLCGEGLRHALVDGWARREAPKNKRCSSVFDTITSGLFRTISSYTERVDFVKALFGRIYNDPVAKVFGSGYLGLECRSVTARSAWPLKNETVLRTIFNVNALKTKTHQLGNQVTTVGYAASVLLQREVPFTERTDPNMVFFFSEMEEGKQKPSDGHRGERCL